MDNLNKFEKQYADLSLGEYRAENAFIKEAWDRCVKFLKVTFTEVTYRIYVSGVAINDGEELVFECGNSCDIRLKLELEKIHESRVYNKLYFQGGIYRSGPELNFILFGELAALID